MPPAPEHDRQHDRRQPGHRGPPAEAPAAEIPLATSVSHGCPGPREQPEHRRVDLIIEPERRARSEITITPARTTTARTSQALVVTETGCGSGGGAPVGRRWRVVRRTAGPGARLAVPVGAVTLSAFSLNALRLPSRRRPRNKRSTPRSAPDGLRTPPSVVLALLSSRSLRSGYSSTASESRPSFVPNRVARSTLRPQSKTGNEFQEKELRHEVPRVIYLG